MADKQELIEKYQRQLREIMRHYKNDAKYLRMDEHNLQMAQTKYKNDNSNTEAKAAVAHWEKSVEVQKREAHADLVKIHKVKAKLAKLGVHANTPGIR